MKSIYTQKSFEPNSKGKLYIVPTPIGNLEDMTYRAVNILNQVERILAEDTRNTRKLLTHFDIKKPLESYHEFSDEQKNRKLIDLLTSGSDLALVSDAGMPGISDPGAVLIKHAIDQEIDVIVLPGANAALCAVVGSGLPTDTFLFYGFLPRKTKLAKEALLWIGKQTTTTILYESPHRLKQTLHLMEEQLGDRKIAVARELTKRFEEYIRGSVSEVNEWAESNEVRGECCIVIEGSAEVEEEITPFFQTLSVLEHIEFHINKGLSSKEAIKKVSVERKLSKRDVYQAYHVDK